MIAEATIVIPLKRQQDRWLEQCVRSATAQTALCEVIVVHAAHTTESNLATLAQIGREQHNLRVMVEEEPGSFPAAINLGIRSASAVRIGLLLSDDWLEPQAVAECLPLEADIVCTGLTAYYQNGVSVLQAASETLTMSRFLALPTLEAKARYLQHFFLFRKASLVQAGLLDESIGDYPGIDDYDLIWTLLECGATVGIVEKRLYNYRDHEGERLTLADAEQAASNLEKILRKHGTREDTIPQMVEEAKKWFGKPIYKAIASR
jgi:hypothetical protein